MSTNTQFGMLDLTTSLNGEVLVRASLVIGMTSAPARDDASPPPDRPGATFVFGEALTRGTFGLAALKAMDTVMTREAVVEGIMTCIEEGIEPCSYYAHSHVRRSAGW